MSRPAERASAPVAATDEDLAGALIAAADGTPEDVALRLADHDPTTVARCVLEEVAARADLAPGPDAEVEFDLGWRGSSVRHTVSLGDRPEERVRPGGADAPTLVVRQDLAELVRAVFGPPGAGHPGREVVVPDSPGPTTWRPDDPWWSQERQVAQALHSVTQASSGDGPPLGDLAIRFGTDKWSGVHRYVGHYERHLAPLRHERVRLLEIGVGGYFRRTEGGASLRMWKHYFRRGLVYGLDVYDKSGIAEPRLHTVRGDQSDGEFLTGLAERIGPLDVVIDDGSHVNSHVLASFTALFPLLRPGGLYVVEDLQTSYWPGFGGTSTDLNDTATSVGFLKTLVDGLHHQERAEPYQPSTLEQNVAGLHMYHNVAFVEKGLNAEPGAPPWISRTEGPATVTTAAAVRALRRGRATDRTSQARP